MLADGNKWGRSSFIFLLPAAGVPALESLQQSHPFISINIGLPVKKKGNSTGTGGLPYGNTILYARVASSPYT